MEYEFHQLSTMFPLMEGSEFDELVADIKAFGVRNPITLYQGKLLDGRNRYRAAQVAGKEIECVDTFQGDDQAARAFVVSENLHRRHLTKDQLTVCATEIIKAAPELSDRAVAKQTGLSHPTIAKIREDANGKDFHKADRVEASGRKARGRKPKAAGKITNVDPTKKPEQPVTFKPEEPTPPKQPTPYDPTEERKKPVEHRWYINKALAYIGDQLTAEEYRYLSTRLMEKANGASVA